jgi:hypothetical protein
MEPDNLGDYVDDVSVEFALWALNGEASAEYQFPPIARVVGRDLAAAALAGEPGDALWTRFLLNALPNLTSEALLSDLVAGQLSSAGFGVATPTAIQSAVVQLAAIADLVPPLPIQLESILADSRVALLKDSAWYRNMNTDVVPLQFTAEGASRVSIGAVGLDFVPVPGASGTLEGHPRAARGGNQDSLRTVGPFSIASHEVSIAAYSLFLDENPQWAPTNRAELVSAGLVDDDYLAEWDVVSQQPELPVTGISYYAATAFGQWVNNRFLPEYTVSLPSESEWNVLLATGELSDGVFSGDGDGPVAVGSAGGAVSGVQGVAGNVWEWLEDWYGEFSALYPDSPNGPAAQRVVRGGSWVTNRLTFDDMDRGSLPPNWCSPFVGFRLVLRY